MSKTWIVIANDAGARLYQTEDGGKEILPLKKIPHPEGRKKDGEINSDRAGRSFDSVGGGRHAVGASVGTHELEENRFAKELVDYLEKELQQHHFDHLALTAPPHLLGDLRKRFSETLKKSVSAELAKDFPEYMNDHELFPHLRSGLKL
ncbi:MAG: host attachment protein [Deltaproteobacteria bacterium]|nr:host attachment protein [Deltaproteobacteria bacterium]